MDLVPDGSGSHLPQRWMDGPRMVELRPVEESDSERLFTWRNLPEVRQFMFNDGEIQRDGHCRWLMKILVDPTRRDWIIEHDELPVGLISLTDIDDANRRCSWGFYVASATLRGQGVGSAAWYQVLQVAFEDLNLEKVCSEVLSTNQSVVALHEKFGFRREAYLRSQVQRPGGRVDVVGLAMLRREWQLSRPGLEEHLLRNEVLRFDGSEQ